MLVIVALTDFDVDIFKPVILLTCSLALGPVFLSDNESTFHSAEIVETREVGNSPHSAIRPFRHVVSLTL